MSRNITPHTINNLNASQKHNFSFWSKSIHCLFCDALERFRAEHILAVSHLAFLGCYEASGASGSNCSALASGWAGAALQPSWVGGYCETVLSGVAPRTQGREERQWDQEEDWGTCAFFISFFPLIPPVYHFSFLFRKGQPWLSYHFVEDQEEEKWICDTLNTGSLRSDMQPLQTEF